MAERKTKKSKKVESDYSAKIGKFINLDLYEKENHISAKITICDAFVIFAKVIEGKNGPFLSYPSFKTSKGDYIQQAYCFDKEVIEAINEELENYFDD